MSKVRLEHELLDSKIATATALLNEWLKWCDNNGVMPYAIPHIVAAFTLKPEDFNKDKS
jgi:hypothetical protein